MDKILNRLYKDTIKEIDNQNLNIIEENIGLMCEVLELVVDESDTPSKSSIYENLLLYLDSVCKQLIEKGLEQQAIDHIIKIYKIIIVSEKNNLFVYFEDSMNLLLRKMREYRFNQLLQLHWDQLIYHMVENSGMKDNKISFAIYLDLSHFPFIFFPGAGNSAGNFSCPPRNFSVPPGNFCHRLRAPA